MKQSPRQRELKETPVQTTACTTLLIPAAPSSVTVQRDERTRASDLPFVLDIIPPRPRPESRPRMSFPSSWPPPSSSWLPWRTWARERAHEGTETWSGPGRGCDGAGRRVVVVAATVQRRIGGVAGRRGRAGPRHLVRRRAAGRVHLGDGLRPLRLVALPSLLFVFFFLFFSFFFVLAGLQAAFLARCCRPSQGLFKLLGKVLLGLLCVVQGCRRGAPGMPART